MAGFVFANLAATATILFILLFRKIFIEKVYPKVFVLLWMLVILRLLVPFEFSSGISLYSFEEEKQSEVPKTEIVFEEQNLPEEKIPFENKTNFSEKTEIQKAGISAEKILFCVWLGTWLEKKTGIPLTIPLIILGVLAGVRNVYALVKHANEDPEDKNHEEG